jgi:hypothetical protein
MRFYNFSLRTEDYELYQWKLELRLKFNKPGGKRPRRRPRHGWEDNIGNILKKQK